MILSATLGERPRARASLFLFPCACNPAPEECVDGRDGNGPGVSSLSLSIGPKSAYPSFLVDWPRPPDSA